jgi:DNA-directed RNA polymerase subunit RPC12/RpoP
MPVETLGEAWNSGWRITMRCAWGKRDGMKSIRECGYRRELDMETLVCTRGRDFPLMGLQTRLRCPRCGSRLVAVMFSPPSMPSVRAAE